MKWLVIVALAGCAHSEPRGELLLRVTPADARVLLDDHDVGSGEMLHDRALRLRPGVRRVEVEADGYYGARREVTVTPQQRSTLTVDLRAVPDGMKP